VTHRAWGFIIRGGLLMPKKYYADAFFYNCPKCRRQVIGKKYYGLFELAEMGAAKAAGLITYKCTHNDCGAPYPSDRLLIHGDVLEVSEQEALSNGLVFSSKGSA
jgi:hypothetical protein